MNFLIKFLLSLSGVTLYASYSLYTKELFLAAVVMMICCAASQTIGVILFDNTIDKEHAKGVEQGMALERHIGKMNKEIDENNNVLLVIDKL